MKVLVAYQSQTGNTKKVAEAIYGEIQGEKEFKELNELKGLEGYDLFFVGFPIHAYGPAHQAKVFLEEHAAGKNVVLFTTHASSEDEELLKEWLDVCRAAAIGANIVGMFNCRGELSEKVAELMKSSGDPKLDAWADRRSDTIGQPDAARLERARTFTRDIMAKFSN
jgi:flavodoxin